jgi:hypothetical protein
MNDVRLDHLAYLHDRPYRRETHATFLRLAITQSHADLRLAIVHTPGRACCQEEPWETTVKRLAKALSADGALVALFVGDPIEVEVHGR